MAIGPATGELCLPPPPPPLSLSSLSLMRANMDIRAQVKVQAGNLPPPSPMRASKRVSGKSPLFPDSSTLFPSTHIASRPPAVA
jgi:hypothetical protein